MEKRLCIILFFIGIFVSSTLVANSVSPISSSNDSSEYILLITNIKNGKKLSAGTGEKVRFRLKEDRNFYKGIIESIDTNSFSVDGESFKLDQIKKIKPTKVPKSLKGLQILTGILLVPFLTVGWIFINWGFASLFEGNRRSNFLTAVFGTLTNALIFMGLMAPHWATKIRKIGKNWKLEIVKKEEVDIPVE